MAKRDIDFLFEVGTLRNVRRAWQQLLTGRVQNISEHVFRTMFLGWMIAEAEGADTSKVVKMILLHDIAESRTGDVAFIHRDYVIRNEELAEEHMLKEISFEKEAKKLLHEYNERKTLEAKIVKDSDNLEVDLELKELSKIGDTAALSMRKDHRPTIRAKKLYTKTAKRLWDELQKTDPDHWHRALTTKWVKSSKGAK